MLSGLWQYAILIGGSLLGLAAIAFKLMSIGKNEEKLKHAETQIQDEQAMDTRVADSLDAATRVRTDASNGKLREDDGFKRK